MNGMFKFKANSGENGVSLCVFFKRLRGVIVVDGRTVFCVGRNLRIVKTSTSKDYENVFTVHQGHDIVSVTIKGGLLFVESERDLLLGSTKTHIVHFEGVSC